VNRGEVWLTKGFGFAHQGQKQSKERPVVIIQNDEDNNNSYYPLIFIIPVTTQKVNRIYKQDIFIPASISGLNTDSKLLFGMLRSIPKKDMMHKIGNLPEAIMEEVNIKLLRMFGFLER